MNQPDNTAQCLRWSKVLEEGVDIQVRYRSVMGSWIEVVKCIKSQMQMK